MTGTYYQGGELHGQDKPFELTTGKATRDKRDKVDCSLNDQERAMLNEVKTALRLDGDSTTLKLCLEIARNVLISTFGKETLQYLTDARRVRPGPK